MAKPRDTRQPNAGQPPKIDKTELPDEKLDDVSGGLRVGTPSKDSRSSMALRCQRAATTP
jgi:hypothetical protein